MNIKEIQVGDIVVFGRSRSANGEMTPGIVDQIEFKNQKGSVKINALERRGRPPKPIGAIWTCHPSVVLCVVVRPDDNYTYSEQHAQGHGRELLEISTYERLKIHAAKTRMKNERTKRVTGWKDKLPANRDGWYWYPSDQSDMVFRIKRANQKTLTLTILRRDDEGVWNMDNEIPHKVLGHSHTIDTLFAHPYQGTPSITCNQRSPYRRD